jgi:hypothetical protein
MSDDEIPDNDWDTEVRIRSLQGEEEEEIRVEVIQRYLDVCDPRPLVSAIINGRRISAATKRRIAAIFDPEPLINEPVLTNFGVRPSRGRFRKYLKPDEAAWVKYLRDCCHDLSQGESSIRFSGEPSTTVYGAVTRRNFLASRLNFQSNFIQIFLNSRSKFNCNFGRNIIGGPILHWICATARSTGLWRP